MIYDDVNLFQRKSMVESKKKLNQAKSPLCKEDLIIAICKCWKEINIGYYQSLVTSMPARIKAVIKTRGSVTKY